MGRPLRRDLTGLRFGRLTVVARTPSDKTQRQAMWCCKCDCGTVVIRSGGGLNRGTVNSCGCLVADNNRAIRFKHGMAGTPLFRMWWGMKQRCHNPNQKHYERYGGRGIYVCDRWRNSFANFYKDMGERPVGPTGKPYQIERIDNDGPYEPKNCKWVPHTEQSLNKRPRKRRR